MPPVALPDANRVIVFDTTLRDGEQAPGFSMTVADKLRVATALAELGVDVLEAGFAAASPGDEAAVRLIAASVAGPVICSMARATARDIDAAVRALEPARRRRCHVVLATSPIHREAKLKMSRVQVLETAARMVAYACQSFDDVEFSAEDGCRTEPDFLLEVAQAVAEAGANTITVPDTVGYCAPAEISRLIGFVVKGLQAFPHVRVSTHCHDDLGLALANSLAAVEAGARQVECAINGVAERAGICAVEELVMALRTREDVWGFTTGVDATRLTPTSRLLSRVVGAPVARNKAVVGANAFAHEAGIHQHGMLSDARTYEIMRPEDVGSTSELVLGKHSGRHAVARRAESLGFTLSDAELTAAVGALKRRADEVGDLDEAEVRAVLGTEAGFDAGRRLHRLDARMDASTGKALALVELVREGDDPTAPNLSAHVAVGDTPLEAAFFALREASGVAAELDALEIVQAGFGASANARAEVTIRAGGQAFMGRGRGEDPLWAGVRAVLDAFNKAARGLSAATVTTDLETRYEAVG
jgi:2-isopropylmalate synthase